MNEIKHQEQPQQCVFNQKRDCRGCQFSCHPELSDGGCRMNDPPFTIDRADCILVYNSGK